MSLHCPTCGGPTDDLGAHTVRHHVQRPVTDREKARREKRLAQKARHGHRWLALLNRAPSH